MTSGDATQVPGTVLALWIYDSLKRYAQGMRSRNVATTFSRSHLEQALGGAPPNRPVRCLRPIGSGTGAHHPRRGQPARLVDLHGRRSAGGLRMG
jgi:hypothetical protein